MVRLLSTFANLMPYEAIAQDQGQCSLTEDDSSTFVEGAEPSAIASKILRRRSSITISNDVELTVIRTATKSPSGEDSDEKSPSNEEERGIYNYNIASTEHTEPIDPFSSDFVGLSASYFSVGLMVGSSLSLLYPVLIVRGGATSSLMAASHAVIMVFWSYKIFFGFLSDCFPIFGYKRKPYMIIGWVFCALVLLALAREGDEVDPRNLVIMLSLANLGYVWADTAADGFMVMVAHREPIEKRGKFQTFCYSMASLGKVVVNVILLLGMSGPMMNCPGFEPDPEVACTSDEKVVEPVDPSLIENHGTDWCHQKCNMATFDWDLSISSFALGICLIIASSIPLHLRLNEDKVVKAEPRREFLSKFWNQLQRHATWQIILYGVTSHITFGVHNAAKPGANYVWLELSTFQQQIMVILENIVFFIGLNLIRRYALNVSWRKMVIMGSCLVLVFNSMYFLIIFDIWRNAWFYMFTDVSTSFMHTLNVFVSLSCMVEVAETGYEAITYSMITAANNAVGPLSGVISYQLLAFFPLLNGQESIATDTPQVRKDFATLQSLVMILNLSSLLTLPLLPRQKKETRDLVASGERSSAWGKYAIMSVLTFLCYSTFVTFVTVKYHDSYGCLKVLGGGGCTKEESSIPALCLVSSILAYCYGTNFYLSYWPILKGQKKFSWGMYV